MFQLWRWKGDRGKGPTGSCGMRSGPSCHHPPHQSPLMLQELKHTCVLKQYRLKTGITSTGMLSKTGSAYNAGFWWLALCANLNSVICSLAVEWACCECMCVCVGGEVLQCGFLKIWNRYFLKFSSIRRAPTVTLLSTQTISRQGDNVTVLMFTSPPSHYEFTLRM